MRLLKSFQPTGNHQVSAEIGFDPEHSEMIRLEFRLKGNREEVGLKNTSRVFTGAECQRVDGLWNFTCFELFLKPVGKNHYYEFNWNTEGAWNLFRFESYRHPQPPTENFEFKLHKIDWDSGKQILRIELMNQSGEQNFQAGITSILKNEKGEQDFLALEHPAQEADFHDEQGFLLELSASQD